MRLGLYVNSHFSPEAGGGFTLEDDIIRGVGRVATSHQVYVFHEGSQTVDASASVTFVPLAQYTAPTPRYQRFPPPVRRLYQGGKRVFNYLLDRRPPHPVTALQNATSAHKVELIWFVTPAYIETDIPYVTTVWDLAHRMLPMFPEVSNAGWTWESREQFYDRVLPRATFVITGAEEGKRQITKFYRLEEERIRVLPFPTPTFALHAQESLASAKPLLSVPYVFYPAQFWPHKNHIVVLHALQLLKQKYALKLHAVFTGSDKGNLRHIQEQTWLLGLTDQIHFPGFVSRDELLAYYRHALALVFPTFFGPDNLPPLEAFAVGCPVVASDIPGAREQLGEAALFASPTDQNAWAESLRLLVEDQTLRETLISRGKERAQRWTVDDYIQGMYQVVTEAEQYRQRWSSHHRFAHL